MKIIFPQKDLYQKKNTNLIWLICWIRTFSNQMRKFESFQLLFVKNKFLSRKVYFLFFLLPEILFKVQDIQVFVLLNFNWYIIVLEI